MIQIITDSSCDLSLDRLKDINVICIPQTVNFGDDVYIDGENITTEQFFEFLDSRPEYPKTALPSPYIIENAFREVLDRGDEILCIFVGNDLSGTAQAAMLAAKSFTEEEQSRIRFADSRAVSLAVGLLVEIAAKKALEDGMTLDVIHKDMVDLAYRVRIFGALDTLTYLKRGGRLSGAAALIGTMLNFCPIITAQDGLVINIAKVKGRKKLYSKVSELTLEEGVDPSYPIIFAEGSKNGYLDILKGYLKDKIDISKALTGKVGPVVGTFSGPNAVIIAYVRK